MAENSEVRARLEEEKDFLERYFYGELFPIQRKKGEPCFEREVKYENGHVYRLRVCIGKGYPDRLPDLVVCESSEPMPNWSGSHDTHTWQPKDGLLRICYFHPWCWKRDIQIFRIFNKGEKWLDAYEKHLVSGKPMKHYLKEMRPTAEDIKRKEEEVFQGIITHFKDRGAPENDIFLALFFEGLRAFIHAIFLNNAGSDITEFEEREGDMHITFMPILPIMFRALNRE